MKMLVENIDPKTIKADCRSNIIEVDGWGQMLLRSGVDNHDNKLTPEQVIGMLNSECAAH